MLVAFGHHRHGLRRPIHSAPGRRRLHQRHRRPDCHHADSRFLSACRSISVPGDVRRLAFRRLPRTRHTWSPASTALAIGALARHPVSRIALHAEDPRLDRRPALSAPSSSLSFHLDVDDDRHGVRRHPEPVYPPCTCRGSVLDLIGGLMMPAMTVALLGAIESLMSAMVADRMSGDRHDSNVELVAQGLANIASPLFGGPARHRRHCQNRDQHPLGRDSRRLPASFTRSRLLLDSGGCRAVGPSHSAVGPGGHPDGGGVQHGGLARDSRAASLVEDGHHRLDRHLRADRVHRSHAPPSASGWRSPTLLFIHRVADTTTVTRSHRRVRAARVVRTSFRTRSFRRM